MADCAARTRARAYDPRARRRRDRHGDDRCLFGGTFAVGDVTVAAFMSLVDDVPVALMAADGDQGAVDGMGFGTYWWFVRESGEHRRSVVD